MKASALVAVGVAVVALASVVGYLSVTPKDTSKSTHPSDQVIHWVCVAHKETHDFSLTVSQLAKGNIVCPVCASEEISRALPCPKCGRHYPISRYNASPAFCTHCNEPLPGADISTFHDHGGH